ncbi:C-terminal binding protein, partial [Desulfovibrio sp. OttesenSCG-928-I05]|nr:C-terminal binding protein [Desulfovibrio sp. OttesenSCG-928-I05]
AKIAEIGRNYKAILVQYTIFDEALIKTLTPGTVLIRYGIGVDNMDLEAARRHGVAVCNLPTYGVNAVAEYAATAVLTCLRRLKVLDTRLQTMGWQQKEVPYGTESAGGTVGLIGYGGISRTVRKRLSGFEFSFRIYDPYATDVPSEEKAATVAEVLETADILSLHTPLTPETRHLLNDAAFARMKDGACLVNTARGPLVDNAALVRALDSGKIAFAVLDVFEEEPLPAASPLFGRENVVITSHVSWKTREAEEKLHVLAGEEALLAVSGHPLRFNLVQP